MTSLLYFLSFIVGLMPNFLMSLGAQCLRWTLFSLFGYRKKVIQDNLRTAFPNMDDKNRAKLTKEAQLHLCLSIFEFLKIPHYAKRNFEGMLRVEGWEHFEAAKAKEKGLLVVTGHLGSFELTAGAMGQRIQDNIHIIVKSFPEGVDRFVTGVRTGTNLKLLPAKGAVKSVLQALKKKEIVVFVQDQNSTRKIGVFVDFFGREACTMSGLAMMALRTEAPVIGVSIRREKLGSHVLTFYPEIPLEHKDEPEESIVHMTQIYTHFLEERIRENPAQWFWTHRRWKTQRTEN